MITQQQLDDARNELTLREERLLASQAAPDHVWHALSMLYNETYDRYHVLLMEYRVAQLKEVTA